MDWCRCWSMGGEGGEIWGLSVSVEMVEMVDRTFSLFAAHASERAYDGVAMVGVFTGEWYIPNGRASGQSMRRVRESHLDI